MWHSLASFLNRIDINWFQFIHNELKNSFFDATMPFITRLGNWGLIWIVLCGFILLIKGRDARLIVVMSLFALAVSELLTDPMIKNLVGRPRPCDALAGVQCLVEIRGPSFPSSHAATSVAAALVLGTKYRKMLVLLFVLAALIAFSRVYVGAHYPFDVIVGILIGALTGTLILRLENRLKRIKTPKTAEPNGCSSRL